MTPAIENQNINKLIEKIGINTQPICVAVKPDRHAEINNCFLNVAEKIKKEGGHQIIGWQIREGSLLVEAEFHSVWQSQSGELIDITPKPIPCNNILFLPDPKAKYEGKQVNNIRINITGNSLVDDFIAIHDSIFKITNKGNRALQHAISLSGRDAYALQVFDKATKMIQMMVHQGNTRNSPCPCNSGKEYKICCGEKIRELVNLYTKC